jgi:ferric-dicitrate binding protein FerR (iron transport regulator)
MEVLRSRFKLGVSLLTCSAVLACTCAAYDVHVRHMWGALLRATGFALVPRGPVAKETIVAAGNELSVEGRRVTVTKVPPDALAQRLAWARIHQKDGWIAFQGETLETVAAEFNRHNGRRLVMGDAATAQLRVGGKFHLTDLDGFLAALEVTHGVKAIPAPPSGRKPPVLVLIGGLSSSVYSDESPGPLDP